MQIIRCNDFLCKYNLVPSNLCSFCNMCTETTKHLFWECKYSQIFWSKLSTFLNLKNITCNFTFKTVSLGTLSDYQIDKIIHFIIIYAKRFIYTSKINNNIPCIDFFKNKLKNVINTERQIALNLDKNEDYERKWRHFLNL